MTAVNANRPPITVLCGPSGSGKTSACVRRFIEAGRNALFLTPSKEYSDYIKARISDEAGHTGDGLIIPFADLGRKMLSPEFEHSEIGGAYRHYLLSDIVSVMVSEDSYFGRMRSAPGFPSALVNIIRELKQAGVSPDELASAIETSSSLANDPTFPARTGQLAELYRDYNTFLKRVKRHDADDLSAMIAERILDGASLPGGAGIVIVDGFYRFMETRLRLLHAMASQGIAVVASLPCELERPLLFASPLRTLERLCELFEVEKVILPGGMEDEDKPPILRSLERGIFGGDALENDLDIGTDDARSLTVFDAPNPYTEVEMVARELRRGHDVDSIPWSQCAIILRVVGDYAPTLSSVFEKYSIPLAIRQPRRAVDHPLIRAVLALLNVFAHDWRRDDVISFLKSSYHGGSKMAAERLRIGCGKRGIREGRANWEKLATGLQETESSAIPLLIQMLEWDALLKSSNKIISAFVEDLERLLLDLKLKRSRHVEENLVLASVTKSLKEMADAADTVGNGPIAFADFYTKLERCWREVTYNLAPESDAVVVMEPFDAQQLDARVVVVMGLVERVFPQRVREDPFIRDEERTLLRKCGGIHLESKRDRIDEERLLFYIAATSAQERLILSYPRSSDESDTLRSFYLDEVYDTLGRVHTEIRTLADVAPRPHECVTDRDRLMASCMVVANGEEPSTADPHLKHVLAEISRPRIPRIDRSDLKTCFTAPRNYTHGDIERYAACPFHYFIANEMGLRPDPAGAGPLDKGTLLHTALRKFHRKHSRDAAPNELEQQRIFLLEELAASLAEQPVDAQYHRIRMMERFLADTLTDYAEREMRFRAQFAGQPTYFELAFGVRDEDALVDDEQGDGRGRDYDSASTPHPFELPANERSPAIHLCGVIDRVDLMPDGQRALVLDYKVGSTPVYPNIKEGKSLQMPLYLMAIEQLWGLVGAVGCYDSPRDAGRRRIIRTDQAEMRQYGPVQGIENGTMVKPMSTAEWATVKQAAEDSIRSAVDGITAADILPTPGSHCDLCDYADVCRTSRDGIHDGETFESYFADSGERSPE